MYCAKWELSSVSDSISALSLSPFLSSEGTIVGIGTESSDWHRERNTPGLASRETKPSVMDDDGPLP